MDSSTKDYSESERALLESQMDYIYESFVARVVEGRKLDPQHVEACARGRVWTGEDAKALGLVDALGGMETALTLARELGKCPDARTAVYPERQRIYDAIVSLARGEPMDEPLLRIRSACVMWLQGLLRLTLGFNQDEQRAIRETVDLLRPQPALKNSAVSRWAH
jgi:protease-4